MRSELVGLFAAIGAAGCACGQTHFVGDAGADAPSIVIDAARDAAIDTRFPLDFTGDAGCRQFHGYQVCTDECIAPCTAADGRCSSLGICYGAGRGIGLGCNANYQVGSYCGDGRICAPVEASFEDPDGGIRGTCVDAELCVDLPAARLNSMQCQYSDGTMFVSGPPPRADCPPSHPVFEFCGGPCLGVVCPEESGISLNRNCLGVSDNRAFGVCGRSNGFNCVNLPERNEFNHMLVDEFCPQTLRDLGAAEEPCAILVPQPQADGLPADIGWPVALSVCRTYRDLNPGFAECVDADWVAIP